jgi:nucleoside-diphosphate-sugar epimerase
VLIEQPISSVIPGRVLVLGASGFVGSHLCRRLVSEGWIVGAVSRSGSRSDSQPSGVTWLQLPSDVSELFDRFQPTAVVNAAVCYGRGSEPLSEMVSVNSWLPLRLAELCDLTAARLIHLDTFSWKPRTGAFIDNSYTRTKRLAGELLVKASTHRTCSVIARLEFPYGPGDRAHKLIPTLLAAFRNGDPIFQMSNATQCRDFIWIGDVTMAIARMLMSELPRGVTEIEVGTGTSMPLSEFVTLLRVATGATTSVKYGVLPRLVGDMDSSEADTSWLQAIGAVPQVTPEEGCRRLVEGFNQQTSH